MTMFMDYIRAQLLSAFMLLIIVMFSFTGNCVSKDLAKSISGPLVSGLCIAPSRQLSGDMLMCFYIISCI